jgi:hypothetical protein
MKLKSMTASFGKLDKARLELGEGFNLIYAPNEGGKSTWCAFWKAMLYGIDTRDRDKKGYLADKNRYQPWSGAPMEGEMTLEWMGRDITIRRGPRGNVPFGSFSAVYTGTEEPVPGLTADTCGQLLTGVGREVFERSAFIGAGGNLAVTAAPELEKRIAALVSSGEEDVSYSQTEGRLREWLNRRKVNRSVGLIPKLEGELEQVAHTLADLEDASIELARLEAERTALEARRAQWMAEAETHRRLAQQALNQRFAQAEQDWSQARAQLETLERELSRFGTIPSKDALKQAQGELQYLKVLDEEIRQGEDAMHQADEAYVQAQIAAQDDRFSGLSGEEAAHRWETDSAAYQTAAHRAKQAKRRFPLLQGVGLLLLAGLTALDVVQNGGVQLYFWCGLGGYGLFALLSALSLRRAKGEQAAAHRILARYRADGPEQAAQQVRDYCARCQTADQAADHAKTVRGALNDRKARRENCRTDLLRFVHSFAPEVRDLFGCSAALSRALGLEHELAIARERTEERLRRKEDLAAQGGQNAQTLELLQPPAHSLQEIERALAQVTVQLDQVTEQLNQARGRQAAMGDPAALAARQEALEGQLARYRLEYEALTIALDALKESNARLQERFSPALNRLAGQYMTRLTDSAYASISLNRELEGTAARPGDVLARSALYLSRGTADQLYLAVRLAVCQLCLPEKPPILLDDALAAFDDQRLVLALDLLRELAQEQQILLFTCQRREGEALKNAPNITQPAL